MQVRRKPELHLPAGVWWHVVAMLLAILILLGDSMAIGMSPWIPFQYSHTIQGAGSAMAWEAGIPSGDIIWVIGSNDHISGEDKFRISAQALSGKGNLLVVGPPCSPDPTLDSRLSGIQAMQQRAWRGRYVALRGFQPHPCPRSDRAPDGLHFIPAGYRELARKLMEFYDRP